MKRADSLEVGAHAYLSYLPVDDHDDKMQSVMFSFTKDTESSLKASFAVIPSGGFFDQIYGVFST